MFGILRNDRGLELILLRLFSWLLILAGIIKIFLSRIIENRTEING